MLVFTWIDYLLFSALLIASLAIGFYHVIKRYKNQTVEEYHLARRRLQVIPVGISMIVSRTSAIGLLGFTAEVYLYGTLFATSVVGELVGQILVAQFLLPVFHQLKLTSINEYLLKRFKYKGLLYMSSILMTLVHVGYTGVAIYAPAAALSAATNIPLVASVFFTAFVTITYTALGGIRAVVWADCMQAVVILIAEITVLVLTTILVGGPETIWKMNFESGRIQLADFDLDPTKRLTTWGLLFGNIIIGAYLAGINQTAVQRLCATKSLKQAQRSVYVYSFLHVLGILFVCSIGIVIYAYYAYIDCDPLKGNIKNPNQLFPFFMMNVLTYQGIPGVFLALLFSASLSTISSYLNSACAMTWKDIIEDKVNLPEKWNVHINRCLVLIYGLLSTGIAFLAHFTKEHVLWFLVIVAASLMAPLLALFLLGLLFRNANHIGALVGCTAGIGFNLWISVGSMFYPSHRSKLPRPSHACGMLNETINYNKTMMYNSTAVYENVTSAISDFNPDTTTPSVARLYQLSPFWCAVIGFLISILLGLAVSHVTKSHTQTPEDDVIVQVKEKLLQCLPRKCAKNRDNVGVKEDANIPLQTIPDITTDVHK